MKTKIASLAVASLLAAASLAQAAVVNVGPDSTLWTSPAGENTGGGSSTIAATPLLDGDGAVLIKGDRTRFATGTLYPNATSTAFGQLADLTAYDFKWTSVTRDAGGIALAQAPALRLHVYDPSEGRRYEIIWEDGEQGANKQFSGVPTAVAGSTFTGDMFASSVYINTRSGTGTGRGLFTSTGAFVSGSDAPTTLANLVSILGTDAYVAGLSVGVGSSAGALYTGYADQVRVAFGAANDTTYNFTTAAVPEPATLAALGGAGLVALRRRRGA